MQPIHSIQVLRALAAFMVAIHHVQPDAAVVAARAGLSFTPPADGRLRRTYVTTYMLRNSA